MSFYGKDFSKVLKYVYIPGDGDVPDPKPSQTRKVFPLPGPEGSETELPRSNEELAKIVSYFCVEKRKSQVVIKLSRDSQMSKSRLDEIASMFCVESHEQANLRRTDTTILDTESRLNKIAAMFCVESPEQASIRRQCLNAMKDETKRENNDRERRSKRKGFGLIRTLVQCLIGH